MRRVHWQAAPDHMHMAMSMELVFQDHRRRHRRYMQYWLHVL